MGKLFIELIWSFFVGLFFFIWKPMYQGGFWDRICDVGCYNTNALYEFLFGFLVTLIMIKTIKKYRSM